MFDHPLFKLLFDLTVNDGWNLTAMMVYAGIVLLIALAIYERKINHD